MRGSTRSLKGGYGKRHTGKPVRGHSNGNLDFVHQRFSGVGGLDLHRSLPRTSKNEVTSSPREPSAGARFAITGLCATCPPHRPAAVGASPPGGASDVAEAGKPEAAGGVSGTAQDPGGASQAMLATIRVEAGMSGGAGQPNIDTCFAKLLSPLGFARSDTNIGTSGKVTNMGPVGTGTNEGRPAWGKAAA